MLIRSLVPAIAAALIATGADAATFFTDAGAFAAATSGLTTGNFVGIAPPNSFASAPSFTVLGVTFDSAGSDFVIDSGFFADTIYAGTPFYSHQFNPTATISFAGTTAFGMTYGSYNNATGPVSFQLSDGSLFNTSWPGTAATPVFFGFVSAAPITSVVVTNANAGIPVFDVLSFSIGSAGVIPEPQSWALMIAGFGLAGAALRRRRAVTA